MSTLETTAGQALDLRAQRLQGRRILVIGAAAAKSVSRFVGLEWVPIRVNRIYPRALDTPCAPAALYLSSRESSFVTGIALAVDGGRSFH
ncbi:MAG TPA: hypothetical protein VIP27_12115 [Variovorax sp.]